jgi:hypothetical protein
MTSSFRDRERSARRPVGRRDVRTPAEETPRRIGMTEPCRNHQRCSVREVVVRWRREPDRGGSEDAGGPVSVLALLEHHALTDVGTGVEQHLQHVDIVSRHREGEMRRIFVDGLGPSRSTIHEHARDSDVTSSHRSEKRGASRRGCLVEPRARVEGRGDVPQVPAVGRRSELVSAVPGSHGA